MNYFTNYLRKIGLFTICAMMLNSTANATIYTAALSGNFNAAATWGGTAPGTSISSDAIIIPAGITVTLTADETFSGTSSLTVAGALTSSGPGLIMTAGTLAGTGTITVDSLALGLVSGITYTGSITVQKLSSIGAGISSAATITVGSTLWLLNNTLSLTAGSLTMLSGSNIQVSVGGITIGGTAILNLANPYSVSYTSSSVTAGAELSGAGLTNITLDMTGMVSLSNDLIINSVLTLTAGTLNLNSFNLAFGANGDLAASGLGNISATNSSDITINATNGLSGNLMFATGGNNVNNFTVNMGNNTSTVNLGSSLYVSSQLDLQSGKVNVMSNSLTMSPTAALVGGSAASYVVTNGIGSFVRNLAAGATDTFQVGTMLNYSPMVIAAITGSATGNVSISVIDTVYVYGTSGTVLSATQGLVSATWFVSSTAAAAFNYNMVAMWSVGMEVNGFNRTQSYISHFTGGAWDVMAFAAATTLTNGMYAMARTGITSLSPFTVADANSNLTSVNSVYADNNSIVIYPNPSKDILHFNSSVKVNSVDIFDMTGNLVKSAMITTDNSVSVEGLPAGDYSVYFSGTNTKTVQTFVKL